MDLLSRIASWLGENEATISAVVGIAVLTGIVLAGLRSLVRRRGDATQQKVPSATATEPAPAAETSAPDLDPLTVPGFEGRPAIAVLPFDNLSGDPEQEYFADGIAEDLITRLSAWRDFPVIARNSTFTYKGRAVDVKQVSRELGVRYVVEGSVRKAGERVRISAQLIDATTGGHVWAETYDRKLQDIFALQDEIAEAIVGSSYPQLIKSDQERAVRVSPQNLSAWDTVQRGWWHLRRVTKKDNAEARALFHMAGEADPQFARAFACVALTHNLDILNQWSDSPEQSVAELHRAALRAVKLDNDDAMGHLALSTAYSRLGEQEQAISAVQFALQLNPGLADGYRFLGMQLALVGRPHDAIVNLEKALRLSPRDLAVHECLWAMSLAHFAAGQYEEALSWAQRSRQARPEYLFASLALAAAYARLERIEEARSALKEVLLLSPGFSLTGLRSAMSGGDASFVERVIDSLRKAGLPE